MVSKIINSFPGYEMIWSDKDKQYHNIYRGTDVGKGGYIISNKGIYTNVALLDVASLHPNSAVNMNYFGEYTPNFKRLMDTRLFIKHKDLEGAKKLWNGQLDKYLNDPAQAKALSQALKIAVNSVYGLTSANFDNPFTDSRNKNNIVALRGALFMRTLQDEVESKGFKIVAIKTDSIKIANATKEIIDFCMDFAEKYGYTFEHETTYDRMCQINDADYIARYKDSKWCQEHYGYIPEDNEKHSGQWTATGAQFAVPYVFKTLFSRESITFDDLCETKSVKSALYLDMNESLPDVTYYENLKTARNTLEDKLTNKNKKWLEEMSDMTDEELNEEISKGHDYKFVGKVGRFCPIKPGKGGGTLVREQNGKYYAAAGTTGYRWLESETVRGICEENIDRSYYNALVDAAVDKISQFGDFEWFVSDDSVPEVKEPTIEKPKAKLKVPCGDCKYETCFDCPKFYADNFHADCESGYDLSGYLNKPDLTPPCGSKKYKRCFDCPECHIDGMLIECRDGCDLTDYLSK